jgi:hypothetical protein
VARTKRTPASKEVDYVAEQLKINYTMPKGLAHMLASASGKQMKEVWCILSEMANICAHRLSKENSSRGGKSWTQKNFPETEIKLRIDMDKWAPYNYKDQTTGPAQYSARIKISGYADETFTQQQVNDYITESILLGEDNDQDSK